jgi:hypothetical protein
MTDIDKIEKGKIINIDTSSDTSETETDAISNEVIDISNTNFCVSVFKNEKIKYMRDDAKVHKEHLREYITAMGYRMFVWELGFCEFDSENIKIRYYLSPKKGSKCCYTEKLLRVSDKTWDDIIIKKMSNKKLRAFRFYRQSDMDSDDSECNEICYSMETVFYIPQSNYFILEDKYQKEINEFETAVNENNERDITGILDKFEELGIPKMPIYAPPEGIPYYRDINRFFNTSIFSKIKNKTLRDRAIGTWYKGCVYRS